MTRLTRRRLLGALSLSTGAGALSIAAREYGPFASDSEPDSDADAVAFDPAIDGFGFDNYATPPESPSPSELVSRSDLRDRLASVVSPSFLDLGGRSSDGALRSGIGAIVDRLLSNADWLFGTKGYCYGMAAVAQWYAEVPAAVPVDRDSTSEITQIDVPVDRSATPVRDDIERFHRSQFTDVDSWVQRLPLLRPERIDYRSQARELRAAIDEYGSAGVTITGANVVEGHYVLLYAYDKGDTDVTFAAYDPNIAADEYATAATSRTVGIDTAAGEPVLGSYAETFDRFLFTREDRVTNEQARADRSEESR
ncbi:hypothetical protein [Haloterrigena salifodinae]|uniref:hypothetical protein n=1 Tax=Haloterrigena salifodinae TaxID=2675099 RepID=UPI000F896B5B|nr:hypothetical protein [Haloterrigena salifodinae]